MDNFLFCTTQSVERSSNKHVADDIHYLWIRDILFRILVWHMAVAYISIELWVNINDTDTTKFSTIPDRFQLVRVYNVFGCAFVFI